MINPGFILGPVLHGSNCTSMEVKRPFHHNLLLRYLTIIPQARMGYESIAHEAEGQMGY